MKTVGWVALVLYLSVGPSVGLLCTANELRHNPKSPDAPWVFLTTWMLWPLVVAYVAVLLLGQWGVRCAWRLVRHVD